MRCKEQGCVNDRKPWNGKGRKPSYCLEHSSSSQRSSRSRSKGVIIIPECCKSLGPRRKCEAHKSQRRLSAGPLDPNTIHSKYWDSSSPEADPLSNDYSPYRREYLIGVTVMSHTMLSMPVKLGMSGESFKVIGQPDLTVDWQPVPGSELPEGLIRRGPDWPW